VVTKLLPLNWCQQHPTDALLAVVSDVHPGGDGRFVLKARRRRGCPLLGVRAELPPALGVQRPTSTLCMTPGCCVQGRACRDKGVDKGVESLMGIHASPLAP